MPIAQGEVHVYQLEGRANGADPYGSVKELLAGYLGVSEDGLVIERNGQGKPLLGGEHRDKLYFNITHTSDRLVAAVATEPVGVDMERLGRRVEYGTILRRYFTEAERADFSVATQDLSLCPMQVFLKGWTRKEAILKAVGVGLGGMRDYEISFSKPLVRHAQKRKPYPVRELLFGEDYWISVSLLGEHINQLRLFNFEKR